MKNSIPLFRLILGLVLILISLPAGAQEILQPIDKDYNPGKEKPTPVSLSGFTGEAEEIIKFDLIVQGFTFTAEGPQYLLSGSANGNLVGRAQDAINKSMLVNKSYTGASVRRQAHAFVDDFLAAIGRKGIGGTKIAYKAAAGNRASEIKVADFDGSGAQAVTSDGVLVAAPTWVPGRLGLFYVSYKNGGPEILSHDLGTGQRSRFAAYPGSNMSPAVSKDGAKVAMILSKDGATDLYVCNTDGSGLRRLTKSREDESSPCWSPDGQWICFAGKSNERRSLWKISPGGGTPVRIQTGGVSSPSEPDWSPDGKWIVFTSQRGGGFDICVVPAGGGAATPLVEGEDPAWGPNSRTVVFAQRDGRGGRRLSLLDVPTKQTKTISRISGINSQPSWAK